MSGKAIEVKTEGGCCRRMAARELRKSSGRAVDPSALAELSLGGSFTLRDRATYPLIA
jgi:hypothetical protein